MVSVPLTDEAVESADAVVIATDHSAFDHAPLVGHAHLLVDTRNACRGVRAERERIVKA